MEPTQSTYCSTGGFVEASTRDGTLRMLVFHEQASARGERAVESIRQNMGELPVLAGSSV
ncbi:MAG: hypothetical protein ACPHF4_14245 [Rubripirellula sp.]